MAASPGELLSKTDAAAMRFLTTELETGLSFARMAKHLRKAKKPTPCQLQRAKRYLQYAHAACEVASRCLGRVRAKPEQLREINLKMSELLELLGADQKP